ncbi:histidine phosphatase family protein [Ammoniphilus sp. CFH 90114]|uniref:histidine phosphatase family protein n=1 Tax=Ammoniphilus sp. CFH 90114 TaxID=2493665 RepID=UPI0013E9926F|nr:histidine phosphatase family protein [Ammoniphilus sp. CFH 90114]
MINHFYLIRHGETDWNKWKKLQGHTDIPLNKQGVIQADQVAKRLSTLPLQLICSSDLLRARQTAEQVSRYHINVPFIQVHDFRERNYGQWEGLDYEEIRKNYPDYEPGQHVGGKYGIETLEAMQDRAVNKLKDLSQRYPNSHIAVISHGGLINALLLLFSDGTFGTGKTKLSNTAFNHISFQHGKWTVHTVNDSTHLEQ